jgi:hypothetical protein
MELKPFGRCTVKMATSSTIIIGMLASGTQAPMNTANPPSNSTRTVAHDNNVAAGIPSACKMLAKSSGPRAAALRLYIDRTILASHPQIHGAGELVQLRSLFEAGDPGSGPIAEVALEKLRRCAPRAARIIDKDLCNFLHLGFIHRIFPRARIVHCRRDPLDTCFSAYTKLFAGDFGFTYEQRELGTYYRRYHALMAHWRSLLTGAVFMEIDYEALVSDPQRQTQRLLEFLDVPWNEACTRFFETSRTVNTSSFAQVRRPIYRSSVGSASILRPHLKPLIEALGDLAPVD